MAYITPNNRILLLHNVPMDMEYENTMWWIDQATQTSTMQSFTKYTCAPTTYQRVNRNAVRVEHNADTLYDVNYMMFQNTNFGNKWFYAFVEKVDYINDAVSEITYRIDEIQTWYFDFTPMYSYVERCHSATDSIGDNIVAEPIPTGEYVVQDYDAVDEIKPLCVIIQYVDTDARDTHLHIVDGVPSGTRLICFPIDTATGRANAKTFLDGYVQQPDAIVAMYVAPSTIITHNGIFPIPDTGKNLDQFGGYPISLQNILPISTSSTLNGYRPKNNNMYTYPYNFITIANNNGGSATYRYEFFNNLTADFFIDVTVSPPVSLKLYPLNYKGCYNPNETETLTNKTRFTFEPLGLDGFPMCSWNADYFKAWLAQNTIPMAIGVDKAGVNTAYQVVAGRVKNPIPYVSRNLINSVLDVANDIYSASIHADIIKGNTMSGNVNIGASTHSMQTYFYARTSVNAMQAEIIDSFFSRFGYAQNKVMLPPRHNRSQFTYVKTVGCKISGSIPCDSEAEICKAFDNGITFWTNIQNVGNYVINNGLLT